MGGVSSSSVEGVQYVFFFFCARPSCSRDVCVLFIEIVIGVCLSSGDDVDVDGNHISLSFKAFFFKDTQS